MGAFGSLFAKDKTGLIDKKTKFLDDTRVSNMVRNRPIQYMDKAASKLDRARRKTRRDLPGLFQLLTAIAAAGALFGPAQPAGASDGLTAAPPGTPKETLRAPKILPQTADELKGLLRQYKLEVQAKPQDAQLRYKLGEAYRKLGDNDSAAREYFRALELDQTLWVAYHQLSLCSTDEKKLDEAISRLIKLETEKPRELLLRVALSELYEKRGDYYQAARTLIDLSYANAVPEKFKNKVTARIHNMLLLAKTKQPEQAQAPVQAASVEEDLDVMPAPLPTPGTKRSLAQAKLKDSKEVRGMGHTKLLQ